MQHGQLFAPHPTLKFTRCQNRAKYNSRANFSHTKLEQHWHLQRYYSTHSRSSRPLWYTMFCVVYRSAHELEVAKFRTFKQPDASKLWLTASILQWRRHTGVAASSLHLHTLCLQRALFLYYNPIEHPRKRLPARLMVSKCPVPRHIQRYNPFLTHHLFHQTKLPGQGPGSIPRPFRVHPQTLAPPSPPTQSAPPRSHSAPDPQSLLRSLFS